MKHSVKVAKVSYSFSVARQTDKELSHLCMFTVKQNITLK